MTSMRPVPGTYPISQPFNGSFSTRFSGGAAHGAIDFATPTGTPVVAPDDGVIVHADWAWNLPGGPNDWAARWFQLKPARGNQRGGGGIMTVLRNNAGSHWIFAHLSSNDEAPAGKRVKRGDIIGKTGNTGTSTGPHLHLALVPPNPNWSNGTYGSIDPAPWLTIPYAPNTYTSWTGTATSGTGSASKAGQNKKPATVTTTSPASTGILDWIDISNHQPTSVLEKVKTDAVVIKASEGVGWRDKHLQGHVAAARKKNLPYMLYHFARATRNGSDAEAKWFDSVTSPYRNDPLFAGLVLDFEEDAVAHYGAWGDDFIRWFWKNRPSIHMALYTRANFLKAAGWTTEVRNRTPVWIAAYGTDRQMNGYATDFRGAPSVAGWSISAWQYSQRGRLPGYNADLDLNRTLPGRVPLWNLKTPTTTAKTTDDQTLEEWIVDNEARARQIIREEVSGTINHLTAEVDDRGRNVMGRVRRAARDGVAALKIPGLGTAEGDMTFKQSQRHERDERGKNIAARAEVSEALKVIAASQSQVLSRLEALERDNDITKENI